MKKGDTVYYLGGGVVTLSDHSPYIYAYPFSFRWGDSVHYCTRDGRCDVNDTHPLVITVEEAKRIFPARFEGETHGQSNQ